MKNHRTAVCEDKYMSNYSFNNLKETVKLTSVVTKSIAYENIMIIQETFTELCRVIDLKEAIAC